MKQKRLPLKDQMFRWKVLIRNNVHEEGINTVVDAYTEDQAIFLAAKNVRKKKYKRENCFVKKIRTT